MLPVAARLLAVTVLSAVTVSGVAPTAFAAPPAVPAVGQAAAGQDARYIVEYVPGTDIAAAAGLLRGKGLGVGRTFSQAVRAAVVTATPAEAQALEASPQVASVEIDAPMSISGTQQPAPSSLDRVDQRKLPLSGSYTWPAAGSGVKAYVVDSGVLASHAEFGGRVAAGWSAVSDGLGTGDCNGHGTHVAGTIAGATYGVAKAATVIPVRVFGCSGSGYTSDVVAGLDWVAANHAAGVPAVVNLSLGGSASSAVDAALQGVIDDGVTAVVAAGNSAVDACTASPARLAAALTVAASDTADKQASFSNFGSCVDMYAPGTKIKSAIHTSNTATGLMSGTSMAAPHAAGAAAVLLSQQPALTPAQVTSNLNGSATTGVVSAATTGTPNRLLFVSGAAPAAAPAPAPVATVPAAPTNVKATAGVTSASITWTKASDGGSALTGQTVTVYNGTLKAGTVSVSASATAVTITGLTAGKSYAFTITATNTIGSSPASEKSNAVTAAAVVAASVVCPPGQATQAPVRDLTRASLRSAADTVAAGPDGTLWNYPANGKGGFAPRIKIGSGWSGLQQGFVTDWNQDGAFDMIAQWKDGRLVLYPGKPEGGFSPAQALGSGWGGSHLTVGQWCNGSSYPGIVASNAAGTLAYHHNSTGGALSTPTQIGNGWGGLYLTMTDFDGDGHQDLTAKKSNGALVLFRSNGAGGFVSEPRKQIGSGWSAIDSMTEYAGFQGAGTKGIMTRLTDGRLAYYPIRNGAWGARTVLGSGWSSFNMFR